jgi:uncharacterized membrane protein
MEARPKIQPQLSKFDKTLELISVVVLITMIGLSIYAFFTLPDIIPTHFNGSGKPDDYGGKATILILPLVTSIIYFGLSKLNQYPHMFNYATIITEANAAYQYQLATRLIRIMKLALLLIFTVIILMTYLTAINVLEGLGFWFLPFAVGLIIIPLGVTIVKSLKK